MSKNTGGSVMGFTFGRLRTEVSRALSKILVVGRSDRKLLYKQIDRNLAHQGLDNAIIHSHRILEHLWKLADRRSAVLAVGACNLLEIYAFKGYGFHRVVGIDLVAPTKNDRGSIKIMDMHHMRFPDDTFEVLYCSGAFHCSHDPSGLAKEFVRVIKSGGFICISVPIDFVPSEVYRFDAGSLENLRALFEPFVGEIAWSESVPPNSEFNPNANTTIRCIFQILKPTTPAKVNS